ncbi:hypothetical protein SRHO_G00191080 [Serrasalmus rhombeus]
MFSTSLLLLLLTTVTCVHSVELTQPGSMAPRPKNYKSQQKDSREKNRVHYKTQTWCLHIHYCCCFFM